MLYYSLLPHYFRNVDWMNRKMVQDVHWLLGNCNPEEIDLTGALELLSMDFPDLMVRRLAVQRLESLSNDEVLKYLLQLVQVCNKGVEGHHSPLAAKHLMCVCLHELEQREHVEHVLN